MAEPVPEGIDPEAFTRLVEEYEKSIPEKISSLKTAAQTLKDKKDVESLKSVRFLIHKIAGNAGSFGFGKVSEICKMWDQKLSSMMNQVDPKQLNDAFFKELDGVILEIEKRFQNGG